MGKNLKILETRPGKYRFPILPWSLGGQALSHPPLDWAYPPSLFNQDSRTPQPSFSRGKSYPNHPQPSTYTQVLGPRPLHASPQTLPSLPDRPLTQNRDYSAGKPGSRAQCRTFPGRPRSLENMQVPRKRNTPEQGLNPSQPCNPPSVSVISSHEGNKTVPNLLLQAKTPIGSKESSQP